jgi:hypothetical protein
VKHGFLHLYGLRWFNFACVILVGVLRYEEDKKGVADVGRTPLASAQPLAFLPGGVRQRPDIAVMVSYQRVPGGHDVR